MTFVRNFSLALLAEVVALALLAVAGFWLAGYRLAAVESGSMVPTFRIGDAVITKRVTPETLKVGDIISFASPEKQGVVISHRLRAINKSEGLLVTRGDHLSKSDTPISKRAVRGKIIAVVPWLGYAVDASHKPLGVVLIGATMFSFVAYECYQLGRLYPRAVHYSADYRAGKSVKV
jgi:signal peptidase